MGHLLCPQLNQNLRRYALYLPHNAQDLPIAPCDPRAQHAAANDALARPARSGIGPRGVLQNTGERVSLFSLSLVDPSTREGLSSKVDLDTYTLLKPRRMHPHC